MVASKQDGSNVDVSHIEIAKKTGEIDVKDQQNVTGADNMNVSSEIEPTNDLGIVYQINEKAMNIISRGLANFYISEDHEKYSKYTKLVKSRATTLDLEAFPALCIICPEFEDLDEKKKADDAESVDSYKEMRNQRFPKTEEESKIDEVQKPKGIHEQKFEQKATPVNTNHTEQKVVVNHKVMSVSVKKDLVQATLQTINNKLGKDKELSHSVLNVAMEVGEFVDDQIWKKIGAKLDI